MSAQPLESLAPRLAALDQRLGAWQQQVAAAINQEFNRLHKGGELHQGARKQEAARLALDRVGEGPRRELNGAVDELCALYLRSDEAQRDAIRALVHQNEFILHDLWGYIRRAAQQIREGGGESWLRLGLAVAAIEDLAGDLHDTLEGLAELYLAAEQNGIHPGSVFKAIAALAADQRHPELGCSTRSLFADFHPAKFAHTHE